MLIVPLQPVPSQSVTTQLAGQYCQINVYQRFFGLFLDLLVDNAPTVSGVLCQNLNRIVRSAYLGFIGDLVFIDNQGAPPAIGQSINWIGAFDIGSSAIGTPAQPAVAAIDPSYNGLGSRFSLAYLTVTDLAEAGLSA